MIKGLDTILNMVMSINDNTKATVFFSYLPSAHGFDIMCFNDEWFPLAKPDELEFFYVNDGVEPVKQAAIFLLDYYAKIVLEEGDK